MSGLRWLLAAAVLLTPVMCANAAENYPARPVRIVVPSGAGGITDILARVIAERLGVSTRQRVPVLPEVPPIADAVPGYEVRGWNGILAPAGTPRPVIERLHKEIVRIVRSPEFAGQIATEGAVPAGNTPEEFSAIIRADIEKWAKVIREAGIRAE